MEIIKANNQKEIDSIKNDFCGEVQIYFGSEYDNAIIDHVFPNAIIKACGNSVVLVCENAEIEAYGNSVVIAYDNSIVTAFENSIVEAYDHSAVKADGTSTVIAYDYSFVRAMDNSDIIAFGRSNVVAHDCSTITARFDSSIRAMDESSVVAWDYSNVEARDYAVVLAHGNSRVFDYTDTHCIKTVGNSKIMHDPKTITEYCDHYEIDTNGSVGKFYKAVHKCKDTGEYYSDYDDTFVFKIGEYATSENGLNTDVTCVCGAGINMSYADFVLHYGHNWSDLAILEVEAELDSIVVPLDGNKVRAPKVKVVREVSLEELGIYGKAVQNKLNRYNGV